MPKNLQNIKEFLTIIKDNREEIIQIIKTFDELWYLNWDNDTDHLFGGEMKDINKEHRRTAYNLLDEFNIDYRNNVNESRLFSICYTALLILLSKDDFSDILNSDVREIKILAKFKITYAIFIEPAIIILNKLKENHDARV